MALTQCPMWVLGAVLGQSQFVWVWSAQRCPGTRWFHPMATSLACLVKNLCTALSQSDGWKSLCSTFTLCMFTVAGAHVDQTVVTTLQEAAKRCGDLKPWHNLVATFETASFRAIPNSSKFYRTNSTSLALLSRRIRSVIRWCLSLQEVRTRLSGLLPLALDHAQDQTWHLVLTPSKRLKQWFQTGPQMTRPLHPAACEQSGVSRIVPDSQWFTVRWGHDWKYAGGNP